MTAAVAAFTVPGCAADVGVSISIGQPSFYGQLDIGGYPPPQLVYRQPMVIERVPVGCSPIYLRVPPGHAKNWNRHCREYNACGQPVYFVQDSWYKREYVPRYQEQHGGRRDGRDNQYGDRGNDHERGNQGRGNDRH